MIPKEQWDLINFANSLNKSFNLNLSKQQIFKYTYTYYNNINKAFANCILVMNTVANYFNTPLEEIANKDTRTNKDAKHIIFYLLRTEYDLKDRTIATYTQMSSRSNVSISVKKIKDQIERYPLLKQDIENIKELLKCNNIN